MLFSSDGLVRPIYWPDSGQSTHHPLHVMIRCLPRGICSWDYVLQSEEQNAILTFNWMTETGQISVGNEVFEVAKQGWLSGHWDLMDLPSHFPNQGDGQSVLASGIKPSSFTRSYDVTVGSEKYLLQARSSLGRTFELLQGESRLISEMAPDHPFTRRASIKTFDDEIPFVIHAFTFWLVGLMWKRQQQSNSS